ncbi:leucine-rich repeat and IQ domain-containing protein 1 isoform X1 [Scleropages formosus]|nr:leucine-rich repeat and IQ domain-containing protein 1 isoform X1 [Scleropages formosus]
MADSEMIERMIAEELSQLDPLDLEFVSSGDEDVSDGVDDSRDPVPDTIPESLLICLELNRKRLSAIEEVILEDLEKHNSVNTRGSEHYKDILQGIASELHEDPVQLKERIMSQIEEEELHPHRCMTCPVDVSEGKLTDEDSTYMETEKLFHLELENLEKKLKEEGKKRHEEYRKLTEQFQKAEREEEEKRRSRHRNFQKELKSIEENSIMQQRNGEDLLQFELCQQEKLIAELQKSMEEERQAFEVAQAREQQRIDQMWYRAATVVQASIRAFLVRKRTQVLLNQKREERMKRQQLCLGREKIEREEKLSRDMEEQMMRKEEGEGRIRQENREELSREMEDQNIREEKEERRIRQENEMIKRKAEEQKVREEKVESIITQENEKVRRKMEDHEITEEEKRIRRVNEEKLRRDMEDKKTTVEEEENNISQVKEKMRRKMEDQKIREGEERITQENEEKLKREMDKEMIRKEVEDRRIRQKNEEDLSREMEEQKVREEEMESRITQENEEKLKREMDKEMIRKEVEDRRIRQKNEEDLSREMEEQKVREEEMESRITQENEEKLKREMDKEMIRKEVEDRRIRQKNEEDLSREMEEQKVREEEMESRITQEKEKVRRKMEDHEITEEEKRIRQVNEEKLRRDMEDKKTKVEEEENSISQVKEKIKRKMEDQKVREEEERITQENEEKLRREMDEEMIRKEVEDRRIRQRNEEELSRDMEDQNIVEEEERRIRQENEKVKRKAEQKIREEEVESRIGWETEKLRRKMEDHKITEEEKRIRQVNEEKLRRVMVDKKTTVEEEENKISQVKEKMRRKMADQKIREGEERIRQDNKEKLRRAMEEEMIRKEVEDRRIRQENEELNREMEDHNIRGKEERKIREENEKVQRKVEDHKIREEEETVRQENEEKLRRGMEDHNIKVEEENKIRQVREEMRRKIEEQNIREEEERRIRQESGKMRIKMNDHKIREERIRQENDGKLWRGMEDHNIKVKEEENKISEVREKMRRKMEEQKIGAEEEERRVRQEKEHYERVGNLRRNLVEEQVSEERRTIQEKEYSTKQEKLSRGLKEPEKVEKIWMLKQEQVQLNKDVQRMDEKGQRERDELEANPRMESRCVAEGGRKQNNIKEDALRRIQQVLRRSTGETQEAGDQFPVEELVALDSWEEGGPQCYREIKHFHNTFLNERNQAGVKHLGKSDSLLLGLKDQEGPRESQQSCSPHSVRASFSISPAMECLAPESRGVTDGTESRCGVTSWCAKPAGSGEPTAAGSVHSSTWERSHLPDGTEQKRLGWMKTCTPWSRLATWNKRKAPADRKVVRRGPVSRLPPLSVDTILGPGAQTSLTQVTTVTLEDLPGCSLSTLSECTKLQALTLRRCGLEALEGISRCKDLKYIDVQENAIKFVNCENLENLRVLLLSGNQLTSIHGLESAVNLDVLELSHNRISRIGGLKSFKRLQKLLIDHNQLISTRGLGEVYTLLHLDCSNNHLTSLEDIDSCALLSTLKLHGNNLTETPCLNSHVLMKELYLDDNCITSLDALSVSWLPMLRRISVSQNSLTELPSLSDCVSLQSLDISHNCLSDLLNVQKSLNGCLCLQEIYLTGNPFQKETTWRSALLEMVPGLWKIDGESIGPPPARGTDGGGDPWPSSFLAFCQAQFVQVERTNRKHMSELCSCSPADVPSTIIRHSNELLLLAIEHHYAHEYGDFSLTDKAEGEVHDTLVMESNHHCHQEDIPSSRLVKENVQGAEVLSLTHNNLVQLNQVQETSKNECQDKSSQEDLQYSANTMGEKRESDSLDNVDSFHVSASQYHTESRGKTLKPAGKVPQPDLKLNLKQMAAVIIQSYWRRYRCCKTIPPEGHVSRRDCVCTEAMCATRATVDQEWAATVIQAVWKGYVLRKRLSVALALAQINEPEEDFDEVDVDEFTLDEAALEEGWVNLDPKHLESTTLPFSHQLLQTKSLVNKYTTVKGGASVPLEMPRQAWPSSEAEKMPCWSSSTSIRSYGGSSRTSNSGVSTLSEKAEKILQDWGFTDSHTAHLMLKRAQKMRSERNRKLLGPAARLALFKRNKNKLTPNKTPKKASPEKTDYFKEREPPQAATEDPRWASRAWTNEWLHKQAADASSQSNHFLPEIDPDVLNGKRVQLVAASGYKDGPHQEGSSGSSTATLSVPRRDHCPARRHSAGPARKEAPASGGLNSCPPKNERISFRDNPVRLSAGWGSGKKRSRPGK